MAEERIDVLEADGARVVVIAGDLDMATAQRAELALSEGDRIVVDMADCDFIDSTGLGVLIRAERRVREAGGRLLLSCPDDGAVARLVQLAGVGMLEMHPTRDDALAEL